MADFFGPLGGSGLPSQTGHGGEFLMTDGTTPSWAAVIASGTLSGTAGQIGFFTTGTNVGSSPNFLWNSGTNTFTVTGTSIVNGDATIIGKLTVGGAIDPTSLSLVGGASDAFIDSAAGELAGLSAVGHGRLIYNNITHTFQSSVNGGVYIDIGGGGSGFPIADDVQAIWGTTFPTSLVAQVAGQTVPNFSIAPTANHPLTILNRADLGSNVFSFDVTPFFPVTALYFAASTAPLIEDYGFIMGPSIQGPDQFDFFMVSGDLINGGGGRNQNGLTVFWQAGDGGSLGGTAGNFIIKGGGSNDGVSPGGDVELQGGGGFPNGRLLLDDHVRINSAGGNPYLEFDHSGPILPSNAGEGIIVFDAGTNQFLVSQNGGAYFPLGGGGGDLVSATLATASGALANTTSNSAGFTFNIPISGVDSGNHDFRWSVAGTTLADFFGTANGVGSLSSSSIQLGGTVPTNFSFQSGPQGIPATDNVDFSYVGGKGGHNNPGFNAGRGSQFNITSGDGGDGFDNSHAPGSAGQIFLIGGTGGTGSGAFVGGTGGNVVLQTGPGGMTGGAGVGSPGSFLVSIGSNGFQSINIAGSNSHIGFVFPNSMSGFGVSDAAGHSYLDINTNASPAVLNFGNGVNNPNYFFLGTGAVDIASALHVGGQFTVQGPTTTHGSVDMQLGPFSWTVEKTASLLAGTDTLQTNTFTIPDLGADSSAIYTGIENDIGTGVLGHNLTGEIIGVDTEIFVQQGLSTVNAITGYGSVVAIANAGTISQVNGYTSFLSNPGAGTIIDFRNFYVKNPAQNTNGSVYGLYIEDQTRGVNNFGIVIGGATTASLLVQTGASIFGGRVEQGKGANVTAANNLVLGVDGNTFQVNGATQINNIDITGWGEGSQIILIFQTNPTLKQNFGGSGSMLLQGSVDIVAASNTVITFVFANGFWYQTGIINA